MTDCVVVFFDFPSIQIHAPCTKTFTKVLIYSVVNAEAVVVLLCELHVIFATDSF